MAASEHAYHRALAPMMWVLVALAGVELLVCHLLLALWDWRVALAVSLFSLAGVVWLVTAIRSFRRLPVLVDGERVLFRAGRIASVKVPLARIAGVREGWTAADIKAKGVRNLALIAWPNVLVDIAPPVAGRRGPIHAVAHRLDDPGAFLAALDAARAAA